MRIQIPLTAGLLSLLLAFAACAQSAPENPDRYFKIQVVDQQTGRGVPMVELRTVNQILYVTDSAGVVAFEEPGLMNQNVFFEARSHGYEYPADGFNMRGFRADVKPGGSMTVKIKRINVAERLYRVTGEGIYCDTARLGEEPPTARPVSNGGVMGQDSVLTTIYKGKLFWIWGDTARASYPLGNFKASGAVSLLPGHGGLDPDRGVDLDYFVGPDGFCRPMAPIEGPGAVWLVGLMTLRENDHETMVCHYARVKGVGEILERGLAVWNEEKQIFEKHAEIPCDTPLPPLAHPFRVGIDGQQWFYFASPYPVTRVKARLKDVLDPTHYEAFTCLKPGVQKQGEESFERNARGELVWAWKPNTAPVERQTSIGDPKKSGQPRYEPKAPETIYHLRDVETGKPVIAHGGSVYFNAHRQKWIMIFVEVMGRSMLGEIWCAEANTPVGPWVYARRVVTHDNYSFYNPKQHPYFDQQGGRMIYFEGTYTEFISGAKTRTPRYDYNQIMYRLDLDDPRMFLPEPVYQWRGKDGGAHCRVQNGLDEAPPADAVVRFYALAPGRADSSSLPVDAAPGEEGTTGQPRPFSLSVGKPATASGEKTQFRAAPLRAADQSDRPANRALIPLFAYHDREAGQTIYAPEEAAPRGEEGQWRRDAKPLCLVWQSPRIDPPREPNARPANRD